MVWRWGDGGVGFIYIVAAAVVIAVHLRGGRVGEDFWISDSFFDHCDGIGSVALLGASRSRFLAEYFSRIFC